MSYTPHTWVDNETITAAKLNNIEDGVQEAAQSGGGGEIFVTMRFSGFVGSHSAGFVSYAVDNDGYESAEVNMDSYYVFNNRTLVFSKSLPPEDSGVILVWIDDSGIMEDDYVTFSGGISSTPITVYVGSGEYQGYLITDNCTISIVN